MHVEVKVTSAMLEIANQKAKELGELKNSMTQGEGNVTGFLGELIAQHVMGGELHNTRDYDLMLPGDIKADVKSHRSFVVPQPHFNFSLSGINTSQACDIYIFVRLLKDLTSGWCIGWMEKSVFFEEAMFIQQGQVDRRNNWRARCDCWSMTMQQLSDPKSQVILRPKSEPA